jgi:hypothetical protein
LTGRPRPTLRNKDAFPITAKNPKQVIRQIVESAGAVKILPPGLLGRGGAVIPRQFWRAKIPRAHGPRPLSQTAQRNTAKLGANWDSSWNGMKPRTQESRNAHPAVQTVKVARGR